MDRKLNRNVLNRDETSFLMLDVQEKLLPVIDRNDAVKCSVVKLLKAADIMSVPVLYTEQYPNGIGATAEEALSAMPEGAQRFEKMTFSCFGEPEFAKVFKLFARPVTVIFGIETHICVLSTIQDMLAIGYKVVIASDACGSRDRENHNIALTAAGHCGALVLPVETIIFQMLGRSGTTEFKAVLPLLK